MRVGLMIPCYIDVFYPEAGIATLELLEKLASKSNIHSIRPAAGNRWRTAVARQMRALQKSCSFATSQHSNTLLSPRAAVHITSGTSLLLRLPVQDGTTFNLTYMISWNFFMT
jgi:hypothetical protein